MAKGPILFELDGDDTPVSPASEPPVPEPQGQAMQSVVKIATRQPSRIVRWFWGLLLTLIGAVISLSAWDFVTGLITRSPVLGWVFAALIGLLLVMAAAMALRELAALSRLARVDQLRHAAQSAETLDEARKVTAKLTRLYAARADTEWGRARFDERLEDVFDADAVFALAEDTMLEPLDRAAQREVEAAARQVATVTALVPLAMADIIAALVANLRMIRRIAEVYGGRSGFWSSWRLTRAVITHMAATGAVSVGDDLLDHVLGGSVLSKISRRFGEGLVNGALTARVGVAAMDVCRPLSFGPTRRPKVRAIVTAALAGLVRSGG